jgi:indole-3-glycerol phosphate synthase
MILDEIVKTKQREVADLKAAYAGKNLVAFAQKISPPRDFLTAFKPDHLALIAEIKKASPSAGLIRPDFAAASLAKSYEQSGVAALSVLTDRQYFQGELVHLMAAKEVTNIPVLRKDFIIDENQVYESRIAGADAILLIARILTDYELAGLLKMTQKLGMTALVETHDAVDVERVLKTDARVIGINNRDLDTLKVNLQTTYVLLKQFPALKKRLIISESGISTKHDVTQLKEAGVNGILVGEVFMRSSNIQDKIRELMG